MRTNLRPQGNHGSAVTSFVTEYRKRKPEQLEPFTIEVEYANAEEIKAQLHELLFSYRHIYRPGLQEDLSQSPAEYLDIEKKSEVALSALQSIFPDCPEIEQEYLRGTWGGNSDRTFEEIESDLQALAQTLKWPAGAINGRWLSTANDASECHGKVAQFLENGLWPLTNIVRYVDRLSFFEADTKSGC